MSEKSLQRVYNEKDRVFVEGSECNVKEKIQQTVNWIKNHSTWLKLIFLGSVLLFVINQMTQILQGMTWADLVAVMAAQKKITIVLMAGIGLITAVPMVLYDWVTVEILEDNGKPRLPRKELMVSAWVTNTINNLAGFGGIIGATLRANFYGKEVPQKKVVTTVSKVAIFMLSGLSILSLVASIDLFFIRPDSTYRDFGLWLLGGSLFTPALLAFVQFKRRTLFVDFPLKRIIKLLLASTGQWVGALTSFLLIGYLLEVPVALGTVYPLFIAATLIGMITMVPGGMGTFDVLMIIGLGQVGIPKELAVVWLLYYRLFYYVVPFLTGILLFVHQTGAKVNQFFDGLPKLLSQKTAHFLLVCMLYFAGIMLVLLSTVPNLSNLSHFFSVLLPFSFDLLDQTLNMCMGFLLLGLARGIASHVRKAYLPTILLLAFCILNTISRTVSWKLIVFYLFILGCVYVSKKELYRKKLVYSWEAVVFDGVLFSFLAILYSIVGLYATETIEVKGKPAEFLLFPSDNVWFSGLAGLMLAVITLFYLYRYLSSGEEIGTAFEAERILYMLRKYGGDENTQLLWLRDKRNYFYQESGWDKVMFSFQIKANKLFVIGDPIGDPDQFLAATLAFMKKADKSGYQLAFYKTSKEYTLLLHDFGFEFIKIGEEGLVDLAENSVKRNDVSIDKLAVKRLATQGYQFQYITAPIPIEVIDELERISDEWCHRHGERYYSVGHFKREYIEHGDIGLARDENNQIVGFINSKDMHQSAVISYDLLRYQDNQPEDLPAFLLTHYFVEMAEKGYQQVDLGITPLANVGDTRFSYLRERLLNIVYQYGNNVSDFQEQRADKAIYVSEWQPRYLAYQQNSKVLFVLLQLLLLIGKKRRRKYSPVEGVMLE